MTPRGREHYHLRPPSEEVGGIAKKPGSPPGFRLCTTKIIVIRLGGVYIPRQFTSSKEAIWTKKQ